MRRPKRIMLAAATVAAIGASIPLFATTPASAGHTLCDNEPSDIWLPEDFDIPVNAGTDLNSPGGIYVCVGQSLVLVRTNRVGLTICSYHTATNPDDDICEVVI